MSRIHSSRTPRVSVGLPTYNGERYIREAIDSIVLQSFQDWELIISDNFSNDETESICRKYAESDDRIKYHRQEKNIGAVENFQFVLNKSGADYFSWAADDDYRSEDFLEVLVAILDAHEDVVCAMTDVTNVFQDRNETTLSFIDNIRVEDVFEDWNKVRRLFFQNPTTNIYFCVYGLFRKKVLKSERFGSDRLKYATGIEIPFLARIACRGRIVSVDSLCFYYRRHAESVYHVEQRNISELNNIFHEFRISLVLAKIVATSEFSGKIRFGLLCEIVQSSRVTIRLFTHLSELVRGRWPSLHELVKKVVRR